MILLADSNDPDQPDQGFHCPHMPKDTFLHGTACIATQAMICW